MSMQFSGFSIQRRGGRNAVLLGAMALVAVLGATGCSSPAVKRQRLVAKPNMTFSDSMVFTYNSARLLPQLAPGLASANGSQNSGCTSCR